jgi:hypothetical protein
VVDSLNGLLGVPTGAWIPHGKREVRECIHQVADSPAISVYIELRKRPVDGFSAGLVDDDNLLEWEIMIMG